jgi:hypothetical protein
MAREGGVIPDALIGIVREKAASFGVAVRELVLRADWPDEESGEKNQGLMLDVYVGPGEVENRFDFWDAIADDCGELSVMVHVRG